MTLKEYINSIESDKIKNIKYYMKNQLAVFLTSGFIALCTNALVIKFILFVIGFGSLFTVSTLSIILLFIASILMYTIAYKKYISSLKKTTDAFQETNNIADLQVYVEQQMTNYIAEKNIKFDDPSEIAKMDKVLNSFNIVYYNDGNNQPCVKVIPKEYNITDKISFASYNFEDSAYNEVK